MARRLIIVGLIGLSLCSTILAQSRGDEAAARKPVEAFYAAFNQGFIGAADFAAEDWAHINPSGGWTRGRENVLQEVRDVHSTFLKGVTETIEQMEVTARESGCGSCDGRKHDESVYDAGRGQAPE